MTPVQPFLPISGPLPWGELRVTSEPLPPARRDCLAEELRRGAELVREFGWAPYQRIWPEMAMLGVRAVRGEDGAVRAACPAWAPILWGTVAGEVDGRVGFEMTRRWFELRRRELPDPGWKPAWGEELRRRADIVRDQGWGEYLLTWDNADRLAVAAILDPDEISDACPLWAGRLWGESGARREVELGYPETRKWFASVSAPLSPSLAAGALLRWEAAKAAIHELAVGAAENPDATVPELPVSEFHPATVGEMNDRLDELFGRMPEDRRQMTEIGVGWSLILVHLDEGLAAIDPDYRVHRMAQDFGWLRFYYEPANPLLRARMDVHVRRAERRAARTCEFCGGTGALVTRRLSYRRLCATCAPAKAGYRQVMSTEPAETAMGPTPRTDHP